jgi:hypothetical protein
MSNLPSRESSILSSAPSNPSEYADIIQAVHERLAQYTLQGAVDQTIVILEALLRQLPIEGRFLFLFFIYSLSVFNLKIMTLFINANKASFCP